MDDLKKENVQRDLEKFIKSKYGKVVKIIWNKTDSQYSLQVNAVFSNTQK